MNTDRYLAVGELPFCKGCGHSLVTINTAGALSGMDIDPLDVILVTDIGCHGIIDKSFLTHTLHGLHGRAAAVAGGISMAIENTSKKIIVFIGDGGATIGMQHIIGAAHYGLNMTVVVHNNMLYGMTGGQPSEFTPCGFKTPALPEGSMKEGYDICEIISVAGSSYTERVLGIGDFSDSLLRAFSTKGFSLVEVMEICPSYGVKSNPGVKLPALVHDAGLEIKIFDSKSNRKSFSYNKPVETNLLPDKLIIENTFTALIDKKISISIAGSAGEGVQSAGEFLAKAAIKSGLHATKKGSYPVTVGVGYSATDVIISPEEILFTGITEPDILLITSSEGLTYSLRTLASMKKGIVAIDDNLETPVTGAEIVKVPFRSKAGSRNCTLYSVFWLLKMYKIIPLEALASVFLEDKISEKVSLEKMMEI